MIKIDYINKKIAVLYLNRPEKLNAMNFNFWKDLPNEIDKLESDENLKVVIIVGEGKAFSAGLDIMEFMKTLQETTSSMKGIEKREYLYKLILEMQSGFNKIANGKKVYIASINGYCIGGGLDMISACDIRLSSRDAIFSLRETKVGIVDDLGSLNRLPSIIGEGETRLLAFTGKDINSEEAFRIKLISKIYENKEELFEESIKLAKEISRNKKDVLEGVKDVLNYNLNHSSEDGLNYVALRNSSFLDI
jgi:enoyl-CoA hydratase